MDDGSGIDEVALEVATALRTENDLLRENYNKVTGAWRVHEQTS